eukprot:m.684806 g.684806  ORF g.684806 m.684806 type:complete len:375 (-) comp22834_c0_seq21:3286-4410(-)
MMEGQDAASKPLLSNNPTRKLSARRTFYSDANFRLCLTFSAAFFMAFTAWHPLQNLETTIAPGHGSGDHVSGRVALGIVYGANVIAAGTFAPVVVRRMGARFCMLFQFIAFSVYLGATMWQAPYTVYPASLLVGAGSAMLWVAEGDFITFIAMEYDAQDLAGDSVIGTFNGVFFTAFALTQVVGNLISSAVLSVYGHAKHVHGDDDDTGTGTTRQGEHVLFAVFAGFLVVSILITAVAMPRQQPCLVQTSMHTHPSVNAADTNHGALHPQFGTVYDATGGQERARDVLAARDSVPGPAMTSSRSEMTSSTWGWAVAEQVRECAQLATQSRCACACIKAICSMCMESFLFCSEYVVGFVRYKVTSMLHRLIPCTV